MNAKFAVRLWIVGCASIALTTLALAADWPQWRGLNRAAKALDFKAPQEWPQELTPKWKVTVGIGDATPALVGDKLYVFARQDGQEVVRCLDANSGQEIWQDKYEAEGADGPARGHAGPRSSPTVAEGKVVTLGVRGMLSCLDAESGKVLWRKDEFKSWPRFFVASSPIVVNGLCIAQVGGGENGAVVAYDLANGEEKWKWSGGSPAYASPVLMAMDDVPLLVALAAGKIFALQAKDGTIAWEASIGTAGGRGGRGPGGFERGGGERGRGGPDGPGQRRGGPGGEQRSGRERTGQQPASGQEVFQQPQPGERGQRGPGGRRGGRGGGGGGQDYLASTPIVDGQTIYYAAGGAIKAVKLEKDGDKVVAKELWSNPEAGINFNSPVLKDGLLFGLNRQSQFFCVDTQSGKTAWTGPRDKGGGYGSIVDAGSVLLAITPGSELVVIKPTDQEYTELARIKVSDTQTYAHLVVAGNRLLVKDEDSIALFNVE
jgi:outer membrane protein assembly factor BamB